MPVVKKRNQQTETRLLLESEDPVELPPAEIDDRAVLVQFEKFKPYIPELLETLRAGTVAEPVPVMIDGSTFAVHGPTRTFWVKLWHAAGTERTKNSSRKGAKAQRSPLNNLCVLSLRLCAFAGEIFRYD